MAVLPFANLSEDSDQGYFAQGFAEDVIRELSRFRSLRVMAAHSSFAAADPHATPREIGDRLDARYLLSGSVRRTARSIRIGTELVDAETGHFLWSNRYDVAPEGIFAAQDEMEGLAKVGLSTPEELPADLGVRHFIKGTGNGRP